MRQLVVLLILTFVAGPGLLRAQDTIMSPAAEVGSGVDLSAEPTQTPGGEAPGTETLPRATRPYWHVFIAFAIAWGLLLGYSITLGRRFAALETQVKELRGS